MSVASSRSALSEGTASAVAVTEPDGRDCHAVGADAQGRPGPPSESAASATPVVTAVLVVHGGDVWLPDTLDALAGQVRPPDRLVVVHGAAGTVRPDSSTAESASDPARLVEQHAQLREAIPDVRVLAVDGGLRYGASVAAAVAEAGDDGPARAHWIWLVHDDSRAHPETLARLVSAVRRSPSVGVAGPKVVRWGQPRSLVEMGHQLTRSGRRISAPRLGEPDQGQYDGRTDVLAVGTSGMLVRRDVWDDIGGFDPDFDPYGADLDLGWRAQLAGHRVIVVPEAVVQDAAASRTGTRPGSADAGAARRAHRRAARQVALTRCGPVAAPFLAVWVALGSIGSALALLVLKRPRHAWLELGDIAALGHPLRGLRSRRRFRPETRLRRSYLNGLFVGPGEAARHTWDRVQDALTPEREGRHRNTAPDLQRATETGPVAEEVEDLGVLPASVPRRIVTNPGVLATLAAAIASAGFYRSALRSGLLDPRQASLSGGELNPVATDAAGLWHSYRDAWHGAGLGVGTEAGPQSAVLALWTWLIEHLPYVGDGRSPAAAAMAWLLVLGMPMATMTAYLAGRVITRSGWPRALVALAWGTSTVAISSLYDNRVVAIVLLVLAPLVVAGLTRCAQREGTYTMAFATALAVAVAGAMSATFLVLSLIAAAALVVAGPGLARRVRAAIVLLAPLPLLGPWLGVLIGDPRRLLGGAGLLARAEPAEVSAVHLALASSDARWLPLAAVLPMLGIGLLALGRSPSRRMSAALTALTVAALAGMAIAVVSPRLVLGTAPGAGTDGAATPWSGVGAAVLVLALLAAASTVLQPSRPDAAGMRPARWRRVLVWFGVALAGVGVLGHAAVAAVRGPAPDLVIGQPSLPAVALDQASGPDASRILLLTPVDASVGYALLGREPGELLRDVDRAASVTDPGIGALVSQVASGALDPAQPLGSHLADLGVGFVVTEGEIDPTLQRTLDAAPGMTRLGSNGGQTLWRVLSREPLDPADAPVQPSRLRLIAADGRLVSSVTVTGPHAATETGLPAGSAGRRLVVAEPVEWADVADVRLDGVPMTRADVAGQPAYLLPAQGGRLSIDVPPAHPQWFVAQLICLAVAVFLAVPFGNRRSRRLV